MEKVTINTAGDPAAGQDRATIVIRATYQEFETAQTTSAYHAFDFLNKGEESAIQHTMKIGPGQATPIYIGQLEWGKVCLILAQEKPRLGKDTSKDLQKAIDSNIIRLTDANGTLVGILRSNRASVVEYPFPVFAQSTHATSLLSVTAFPVIPGEEIPTQ